MLFAFSVAPATTDDPDGSVSAAVADAIRVVRESGVPYRLDSMFTTLEGEWDECMPVIKAACDAVAKKSPRVSLVVKADLRPGVTDQLTAKVERVEQHLHES
ncbi:MTH1187 family thiamine-binding protein [Demetria terragena]|uniref:MTH1187 family thiamine-binding protein n=1 Tax=Demetria terragena TaxID=63959 RepID=UPI0003718F86|nr:MTH1187 family thiamine-binding protein [Demetria terragena]